MISYISKNKIVGFGSLRVFLVVISFLGLPSPGVDLPQQRLSQLLSQVEAYDEGQPNPAPGSYFPEVPRPLRLHAERVQSLAEFTAKLYRVQDDLFLHAADLGETLAYLEIEVLKTQIELMELSLTSSSDTNWVSALEELLARSIFTYSQLRGTSSALYEHMIRHVDRLKPGPHSPTFKQVERHSLPWSPDSQAMLSLYQPNFRSPKALTRQEQLTQYVEMANEYLQKTGQIPSSQQLSAEEFDSLLEKDIYNLEPGSEILRPGILRVEYVLDKNFEIKATETPMGHVLLGKGQPVFGAGQVVALIGKDMKLRYAVISNSSGNYKPEVSSLWLVEQVLKSKFSGEQNLATFQSVIPTTGEPLSHQALKIFLRAADLEKTPEGQWRIEELQKRIALLTKVDSDPPRDGRFTCRVTLSRQQGARP